MVAGNVVEDRAPDGSWVPGGPSLYSARTAAALGAEVTLITRLPAGYDRAVLAGLELQALDAGHAPRYANSYTPAGDRAQLLLHPGEPLDCHLALPRPADALLVAPAYHEFDALPVVPAKVLAVSYQGILRRADGAGRIHPTPDPDTAVLPFAAPGSFAFFSEEDTAQPEALAAFLATRNVTVLLTRGYRGAVMYHGGSVHHFEAVPATATDPTGAGDCFATAFVVRYIETARLKDACHFALAAGSLAVEAPALAGVPTRAQIESRMARVAA